ncbi:hypothetical protein BDD12DRAFT_795624 [Trichophaea hybrida]|nr:hypothetical protein BDD12DRAFT_795624 [Trichophaea hybrida]
MAAASDHPHETYDKAILATLWIFTSIALGIIITRLTWRYRRGEKFYGGDIWMAVSIVPLLMRLVCTFFAIVFLTAHFDHDKYSEAYMSEAEIRRRTIGSVMILPARVCYAGFLWCMKAAILNWFEKVTGNERPYDLLIRVWPDPGDCVAAKTQLLTMGMLNITTDLYLMVIPLPIVFQARLPVMRKIQLTLLFSVSLFVVSITVIRMPIIIGDNVLQNSRSLWASIEVMTACLVANAPVLNSFLHTLRQNHQQQNQYSSMTPSSQRRRVMRPVTGEDSFGSLRRNGESAGIEITSQKESPETVSTRSPTWSKELRAEPGDGLSDMDFPTPPPTLCTKVVGSNV